MAHSIFISFLLASLLISFIHGESNEQQGGFVSVDISNKGLNFAKNILVETAESSLVPLELPDIKKSVDIPVVGKVEMTLSNVVINTIDVVSSTIKTGDSGILIAVSGATANLTMNWRYSYKTWLLPVISDEGKASVQVEGMDIGLTLSLQNQQGSLSLSFLECGCFVEGISIHLDGGASWLYQGVLDAFEGKLVSAVEDAVSTRIGDGVVKLDSVLQSLPNEIQITEFASLNVSFIGDPVMSNSSVVLAINGLLNNTNESILLKHYHGLLLPLIARKDPDGMITIFLHENVIKSALSVYFKADKMHWIVDQVPDQALLNTAEWRFIIPKLYKLYPNDDMSLNISVSSTPSIKIEEHQIYVMIPADIIINVLDEDEVVPVACISVEITGWVSAKMLSSILSGSVKLDHYTMSLKWSKIGNLHLFLVQTMMSAMLRTVVLPLVNIRLQLGYHLPSFYGYELQNAEIFFTDSWITISSDVAPIKQLNFSCSPSLSTVTSSGMYMV
ncbi:PREDICTED: putative BPI/LBP family protein At1g04970 [Ipomoea nil]|uniref:putative BPI/LBP family protein At1g04970 n=1 Tax=Ipomoea nil TaxID=35883 RepID=UPI0009013FDA|nr:PREDICTED: putative BPI/LBP family protein At1g04970 [Ipomoea nil]